MDLSSVIVAIASVVAAVAATKAYIQSKANGRALARLLREEDEERRAFGLPPISSLATGKTT